MKIKITDKPFSEVRQKHFEHHGSHKRPKKPNIFFRTLMRLISIPDLLATKFSFRKIGMETLGKKEPAFFLMNHSSFIDLEIAATVLYPRPFNIVATTDAFIGKEWLMRQIGCIPTKKFVADTTLVRDILYTVKKLKSSVVMFPEVGYSIDGTATTLPNNIGKCVKMLGVPLVMIRTYGAFARDPLYNNLQRRRVKVSSDVELLLSAEQVAKLSDNEITNIIKEKFSFDNFRWQKENMVRIDEPFRADGLERVLYKCPACHAEGRTVGKGIYLTCTACGKKYRLSEYGEMECEDGEVCEFSHIPDWFKWEKECLTKQIHEGKYSFDAPVEIIASPDTRNLYRIGTGRLTHDPHGFVLKSDDGELHYEQKSLSTYSICVDFNWYELGDIVAIGDNRCIYYCFPKIDNYPVIKMRIAAEELHRIAKAEHDAHNEMLGEKTGNESK